MGGNGGWNGVKSSYESEETWKLHSGRRTGCECFVFFLFGFFKKIEYEKYRHKEKEGEVQSKKG